MKKISKIIALLLAAMMLATALCACGEKTETEEPSEEAPSGETATETAGELIYATSADYAPFEFIILDDNGEQQYVGIDLSVAKTIAEDMGKELKVLNMDFDSLMAALQKGDADIVIAAIEESPDRLEAADFSDPYYTDYPPMLLIKADKAEEYTSVEALSGKSVGAQTGTTKAEIVTNDIAGANLIALTSVNDLVNQLVYDKVDAILLDGAVALQYAQSNSDLKVADISFGEAAPYCVAVQKGDPKGLLTSINATIAKLLDEGKIEEFSAEADSLLDKDITGAEEAPAEEAPATEAAPAVDAAPAAN